MKKETIIAIVFGIVLGGTVAFFILLKGKDFELTRNKMIAPKVADQLVMTQPSNVVIQSLEISEPLDGAITDKNSIVISGKVTKGSLLVMQSPINDMVFVADGSGFSKDFPLALGENVVKIVAYPKDKTQNPQEKNLKIYYIDSEL